MEQVFGINTSFDISEANISNIDHAVTELGLKEAKALVDSVPKQVKENLDKNLAENAKKLLEEAGGVASIH